MGNLQRQGVFCEMKVRLLKNFRCSKCGGLKMIGSQYYAMQRNWIDVTCVNCSDSKDIERQWVYLGHLACDMGELIGKTLWKEVTDNLDGIDDLQLIVGDGCQFLLALQLKGKLVFGTNGQIIQLADILANNQPLNNFSANVKNAHPYGLILQMAGWRL